MGKLKETADTAFSPPPFPVRAAWFGFAYLASAFLGDALAHRMEGFVPFWLPSGLYLAALLAVETRRWPALAAIAVAANLSFDLWHGQPLGVAAGFAAGNSLEALAGAWLVRRFVAARPTFSSLKEVAGILLISAASCALNATLGASLVTWRLGTGDFASNWLRWWAADVLAILLVAPLVLGIASGQPGLSRAGRLGRIAEAAILGAGLALCTLTVFSTGLAVLSPRKFLLAPLLLWAGLRLGMRAGSAATLAVSLAAVWSSGRTSEDPVTLMQLFLATACLTWLLPASLLAERRQAESELRASRALLEGVVEGTSDAIFVKDTSGRYLLFNAAAEAVTGKRAEEALGRDDTFLFPPEEARAVMEGDRGIMEAGLRRSYEEVVTTASGERVIYLCTKGPLFDQSGAVTGIFGIARDISERKAAEERLKAERSKLEALWSIASLADADVKTISDRILVEIVRITGSDYGFYGFVNPDESVMTIHSWSGEAMKDCSMVDQPSRFRIDEAGVWAEAVRRREPLILNDYAAAHPAKKGFPVGHVPLTRLLVVPCFMHGRIAALAAVANRRLAYSQDDVTQIASFLGGSHAILERRQAEEALWRSTALLRAVSEGTPVLICTKDRQGRMTMVNPAMARLIGKAESELLGKTQLDYFPDSGQAARVMENDRRVMESGRAETFEETADLADGQHVCLFTKSPYLDERGQVIGLIAIGTDITGRKKLEERLHRSQKAESIGRLVAGVAHDFNNLLTPIQGYAQMLEREARGRERGMLGSIVRASQTLAELTRQLLAYAGKGQMIVERVDVPGCAREMCELLRASISKNVDLRLSASEGPAAVDADPGQIKQIVVNLVLNGAEAVGSDAPGSVTVATRLRPVAESSIEDELTGEFLPAGSYVSIEVADTGCGIDDETRKKLFDPFFTTKFTGRGLGLAAVAGITRSLGGGIRIETVPGFGSTFHVFLPASQGEVEAGATGTVLVVDDEPMVLGVVCEALWGGRLRSPAGAKRRRGSADLR